MLPSTKFWNEHVERLDIMSNFLPKPEIIIHPFTLLNQVTNGVILESAISEVYNDKVSLTLKNLIENQEKALIPIDNILGSYFPEERKIEIYKEAIRLFANHFSFDINAVEYIVRVHEWSHALLHLGIFNGEVNQLGKEEFIETKNTEFRSVSEENHEFMAQALTYSALKTMPSLEYLETFLEMMDHQPDEYKIEKEAIEVIERVCSTQRDWNWLCLVILTNKMPIEN